MSELKPVACRLKNPNDDYPELLVDGDYYRSHMVSNAVPLYAIPEGYALVKLKPLAVMCVGNLKMSYSMDAHEIGQPIYEATGLTNPELDN